MFSRLRIHAYLRWRTDEVPKHRHPAALRINRLRTAQLVLVEPQGMSLSNAPFLEHGFVLYPSA